MSHVTRVCPVCSTEYQADEGRLKHGRQTTCSRECSYTLRGGKSSVRKKGVPSPLKGIKSGVTAWNKKPKTELKCSYCDSAFHVSDWQLKRGQKYCSRTCADKLKVYKNLFESGHPDLVPPESRGHSEETKIKISNVQRKAARRGDKNPLWKGGARKERKIAMGRYEYKEWRKAVFERDNYTCQECGVRGCYLEADHIKPWCAYPEFRYSVENGRTLCRPCHVKQDTHGIGALKYLEAA